MLVRCGRNLLWWCGAAGVISLWREGCRRWGSGLWCFMLGVVWAMWLLAVVGLGGLVGDVRWLVGVLCVLTRWRGYSVEDVITVGWQSCGVLGAVLPHNFGTMKPGRSICPCKFLSLPSPAQWAHLRSSQVRVGVHWGRSGRARVGCEGSGRVRVEAGWLRSGRASVRGLCVADGGDGGVHRRASQCIFGQEAGLRCLQWCCGPIGGSLVTARSLCVARCGFGRDWNCGAVFPIWKPPCLAPLAALAYVRGLRFVGDGGIGAR